MKRKKRGFAVNVVDDWFHSSLNSDLPELLLDETSLMFDLLKPESVRNLLSTHRSGRQDNHKLLFSLVMLEQWLRRSARYRKPLVQTNVPHSVSSLPLASSAK
jgi:asparagine synthase (glutamine-hydrolysing)